MNVEEPLFQISDSSCFEMLIFYFQHCVQQHQEAWKNSIGCVFSHEFTHDFPAFLVGARHHEVTIGFVSGPRKTIETEDFISNPVRGQVCQILPVRLRSLEPQCGMRQH